MADLNRKKRVRTGHKASVTRMLHDSEVLLTADPPDMTSLATPEVMIWEKILVLDGLDNEIFDLLDLDDAVAEEIQQSDGFKKGVRTVLVRIEQLTQCLGTGSTAAPHQPLYPRRPRHQLLPVQSSRHSREIQPAGQPFGTCLRQH